MRNKRWKTVDKEPPLGERILVFSPEYPVGHEMRFRCIDSQMLNIMIAATHWMKLEENGPK